MAEREFRSFVVDDISDEDPEWDYQISNESGSGLIWCTERQLRELYEQLDDIFGGEA